MLTFLYVVSGILTTVAILIHALWTRVVTYRSNFEVKYRNKLLMFSKKIFTIMIITATAISLPVFFMEKSDALTFAKLVLNLLIITAHLYAAHLTVRFIKGEQELKSKVIANDE